MKNLDQLNQENTLNFCVVCENGDAPFDPCSHNKKHPHEHSFQMAKNNANSYSYFCKCGTACSK